MVANLSNGLSNQRKPNMEQYQTPIANRTIAKLLGANYQKPLKHFGTPQERMKRFQEMLKMK